MKNLKNVGANAHICPKQQGITLLALVVTIIVLLILAGVSLNLVAGNNGILRRATTAVKTTNEKAIEEKLQLAMAELQMDYYAGGMEEATFADYLKAHSVYNLPSGEMFSFEVNDDNTVSIEYYSKSDNDTPDMEFSFDLATNEVTVEASGGMAKPDTKVPVIQITTSTTSSLTFKITDKGGVAGYKVTASETEPSDWESLDGAKVYENLTEVGLESYKTYYIWAIDKAGNVSHISGETKRQEFTITYDANGGTGEVPASQKALQQANVKVDTTATLTKHGYNFLGWALSNSATSAIMNFEMPTSDVTLYAVWQAISGTATEVIRGEFYGDKVNYSANGVTDWKIFSKDGDNIYLITEDVVPGNILNVTGTITINGNYVYTTDNTNTTLVNWMTNTSNWINFVNTKYAEQALGGATLEQLAVSANGKLKTSYTVDSIQGEMLNDVLYKASDSYWIATSYSDDMKKVWRMHALGFLQSNDASVGNSDNYCRIRPLVRLKSNVKMTWSGSAWDLSI